MTSNLLPAIPDKLPNDYRHQIYQYAKAPTTKTTPSFRAIPSHCQWPRTSFKPLSLRPPMIPGWIGCRSQNQYCLRINVGGAIYTRAFVILDDTAETQYIRRDHVGNVGRPCLHTQQLDIKVLYVFQPIAVQRLWCRLCSGLAFASSITAISCD